MEEPIFSPDGNFMWTGNEWIPAPPTSSESPVNLKDSVVMGDITNQTTYVVNSDDSDEKILNFLKLMLKKYRKNDFKGGLEEYNEAKKINYDLAEEMYIQEFREKINEIRLKQLNIWVTTTRDQSSNGNVHVALSHWQEMTEIYDQIKEDNHQYYQYMALECLSKFYSSWHSVDVTQAGISIDSYILNEFRSLGSDGQKGKDVIEVHRKARNQKIYNIRKESDFEEGIALLFWIVLGIISFVVIAILA